MKVLVADKLPQSALETLESRGFDVKLQPELKAEDLPSHISDCEALIVRSTKVNAETFDNGKNLQLVVRAGAGTNTIDVPMASRRGVFVANCPGKNATAVAELTMGLVLSLDRRIPQANADLKNGKWGKKEYAKADGLLGKTYGVMGFGNIGKEVAKLAKAFGMTVYAWSRSLDRHVADEYGVKFAATPRELAEACDIVSLHLAKTSDTANLVNASFLESMKPQAMLINASREGIVDEDAVQKKLGEGLRYATDVFAGEPGSGSADFSHTLAQNQHVVCTPHIGASTEQSQVAVADEAVRILTAFRESGEVPNCVNLCVQSPAHWQLNVRHEDKVGVLANVLSAISAASINVEELENVIFDGAEAACARVRLAGEPQSEVIEKIKGLQHVIDTNVIKL
jgi:D-3-phosphoglycerate dehydrogenase